MTSMLESTGLSKEVLTAAIILYTSMYASALGSDGALNIGVGAVADYLMPANLAPSQIGYITDLVSALGAVGTTLGVTAPSDVATTLAALYSEVND